VEGFHASETLDVVFPVTRRFEGAVGGVRSRDAAETLNALRKGKNFSVRIEPAKPTRMTAKTRSAVTENRSMLRANLF
jgi:hypothetical protein